MAKSKKELTPEQKEMRRAMLGISSAVIGGFKGSLYALQQDAYRRGFEAGLKARQAQLEERVRQLHPLNRPITKK